VICVWDSDMGSAAFFHNGHQLVAPIIFKVEK